VSVVFVAACIGMSTSKGIITRERLASIDPASQGPSAAPEAPVLAQVRDSKDRREPMKDIRLEPLSAREAELRARKAGATGSLVFVEASRSTVWADQQTGRVIQTAEEWQFVYHAGSAWKTFTVSVENITVEEVRSASESRIMPPKVFAYEPLRGWSLDSDQAFGAAESYGGSIRTGTIGGSRLLQLKMCEVDGASVPLWWLPYYLEPYQLYIRADNGVPAFRVLGKEPISFTEKPPAGLTMMKR
jgi:hypothetical protein